MSPAEPWSAPASSTNSHRIALLDVRGVAVTRNRTKGSTMQVHGTLVQSPPLFCPYIFPLGEREGCRCVFTLRIEKRLPASQCRQC